MQLWRALLQIAFCCPMTQEKKVLWYWESSKHKTEPTQNCTTGDLAWDYQMRYELACNSIQETTCSQKQEASGPTPTVGFSNTPQEPWKHYLASHVRLLCWDIHTFLTCLPTVNSASRTRRSLPRTCVIQLRHKPSTSSFHLNDRNLKSPTGLKSVCPWLGVELNFEKSATHWPSLKTKKLSMIGTWSQLWEIRISLRTAEDSGNCWWLGLGLGHEKSATH